MEDKERDSLKLSNLSTDWISEHEHYTRPVYSQFNDLQQSSDIAQHAHASVIKSILYLPNSNNGTKIVFHKIVTCGHHRLQPLFDCILTIIVNISPYLKQMCMVSASKLMHLLEAFSTPWFLFANQTNYHLVFFLLEIFNNIIQYQFDGNSHLIYSIIRKRHVFHQLSNLPEDPNSITKPVRKRSNSQAPTNSFTVPNSTDCFNKPPEDWRATKDWVSSWRKKLPLQTIMRLLQVLVPQVEKICIDKHLTDESEIISFLQNGTLVGLLPVPHPILMRKYQPNAATSVWFRRYMWGLVYMRNITPPIWSETNIQLFEVQKMQD